MSDNSELSDADKIRLKRLARLGASTFATPESSSSQTASEALPAPSAVHTPASASSRLLSTPIQTSRPPLPPTSTVTPKPRAIASPAPTSSKPAALNLGKRPSSATPTNESIGPRVVASRQQQSLPHVDYTEWETSKVGEVFSVTLSAFSNDEKHTWTGTFDKLKALIISYCGMTLEDPTMFPQPSEKPVGPAEFLPLLLSVTPDTAPNPDSLTSTTSAGHSSSTSLSGSDLLPFLNDLSVGFPSETMADVITPTLSLFFQEWYKITPTPDLLGPEWRRYLGAVGLLVQVKGIAALLPSLGVWVAPNVTAPKLEWQSLLGPLTRLSVFPREFIWKTYFSNPTDRKKDDIDANKSNLRYTLSALHTSLFNIYNAIVRASPESREGVLDFFSLTLRLNEKRAGMRIVLMKLFEPVMDVQFSKVDSGYYKSSKRLNIDEETKIRGTKEEADEYFNNAMEEMEKELKRMEANRASWAGNSALEAQGEAGIKKIKVSHTLPLPAEAPLDFRMLPEYLFDNIAEYYDFLARYEPDAMDDIDKDTLITFAITFLSPNYVNNPFLKAKLVSILAYGLWPMGYWRRGALFDRLSVHSISTEHLMPTLIRFYIDVEMTGGHTQFWDKFNFRRDISRIFKSMWTNPLHREAFVKARHDDFDQFIRFVNMLMSDTTFHLEESLTGLAKVSSIQAQQANADSWAALPQAEREDLESQVRQAEGSAPFHTQMGLENVKLIRDLTATTPEPFVTAEIVDRLAASLDENLTVLIGPKMAELKVSNPDKFSFKPKELLATIAQIYLNLAKESDFIRAVANDGRSYSKELFEKFARTLKNRAIMTDAEVAEVIAFTQKVEDMRATIKLEDEREIPDEFLDPLLSTLMKDPVILPVSRVVIDRGTIRTVLLSKEVDPFNNVPLKLEECIPDTELKAKIDVWLAESNSTKAVEVMDVDQL
ncbi:hypothetical protein IAR55_001775 [Kwoniella newhampshirensis]|uniref:RING-type E3 ubiquitin transferase n=1 Tax=Kwoniella newhampshirensis TaxID=1651941 RepID=A0AAW0Z351_9TREE